jgi:hypothetical protein
MCGDCGSRNAWGWAVMLVRAVAGDVAGARMGAATKLSFAAKPRSQTMTLRYGGKPLNRADVRNFTRNSGLLCAFLG